MLRRLALISVIGLGAVVLGGLGYVRSSLPQTDGHLRAPGLIRPVTITRDDWGIPRIVAESEADAYFALGWVHAQDRLWQMEMQRRTGAGRLAEVLGTDAVETDKFLRTLGLYRLAEIAMQMLRPEVKAALQAYAAGVNSWIEHHEGALPPEFLLLGYAPEPWRPADSLVWGRLMGLQLAGNWREELLRARLLQRMPAKKMEQLWAPYPPGAPSTVALDDATASAMLAATPEIVRPRLASNAWVLAGSRTESGKPLLANDPHLGFEAPVLWYLVTVTAPGLTMTGATVPGVPFHLLGHNGRIAWGITTTHGDLMDLFIEKPGPEPGTYLTPQGAQAFDRREEVIVVKDAEPVRITVRATRHGPVISDVLPGGNQSDWLALASATLEPDDRTAQAFYLMNRANNWHQFVDALADFHSPQQNVMYADSGGAIGFYAPGRVPIRRTGDGLLPRPGWTGEYDWIGWIPFAELPQAADPPTGLLVNANNQIVPRSYPYLIAAHWPEPHRAERITSVLTAQAKHDLADMQRLQQDTLSPVALHFKGLLTTLEINGKLAQAAAVRLRAWDGRIDRQRPEPLIVEAWLTRLQRMIVEDDLGELAGSFALLRPLFLDQVLSDASDWCDDARTDVTEDCATTAARAFTATIDDLAARHGADMSRWQWGEPHTAVFEHPVFTHVPLLDRIANLTIATDGDDFTVNRGTYGGRGDERFTHFHGAGLRAVYDLGDLANSRFMLATGQSGNIASPHYADMLEPWRDGAYVPVTPVAGSRTLVLEPSP